MNDNLSLHDAVLQILRAETSLDAGQLQQAVQRRVTESRARRSALRKIMSLLNVVGQSFSVTRELLPFVAIAVKEYADANRVRQLRAARAQRCAAIAALGTESSSKKDAQRRLRMIRSLNSAVPPTSVWGDLDKEHVTERESYHELLSSMAQMLADGAKHAREQHGTVNDRDAVKLAAVVQLELLRCWQVIPFSETDHSFLHTSSLFPALQGLMAPPANAHGKCAIAEAEAQEPNLSACPVDVTGDLSIGGSGGAEAAEGLGTLTDGDTGTFWNADHDGPKWLRVRLKGKKSEPGAWRRLHISIFVDNETDNKGDRRKGVSGGSLSVGWAPSAHVDPDNDAIDTAAVPLEAVDVVDLDADFTGWVGLGPSPAQCQAAALYEQDTKSL